MSRHKSVMLVAILCLVATMSPTLDSHGQVNSSFPGELEGTVEGVRAHVALEMVQAQFYENIGQIRNEEVKLYGMTSWGAIGFAENEILFYDRYGKRGMTVHLGGDSKVVPRGQGLLGNNTTYILGNRGTFAGVRTYSSIAYSNIWPRMSLVFRITSERVVHELCISAGTGPLQIQASWDGPHNLSLRPDPSRQNAAEWQRPDATPSVYLSEGLVSLESVLNRFFLADCRIGESAQSGTPTNMPFLYSTLVGGADLDKVNDITIDSLGNAYLTGRTRSPDFPTERAFDSSFNAAYPGLSDCFVLKVNSTGNGIVYSTFIGGIAADGGEAIEVDSLGNVYVGGTTTSPDFPTKSALDDSYSESTDCFLLKLNASGSGLVYSTFVGGLLWEVVNDIVIDSSSNLYAVGFTASGDFPTVNAFDASHGGSHEGFVLKLNATGNGLFYSTFIGGNSTDSVTAVTEGPSGTLYITGHTISPDFPIVNGINSSLNGLGDCFVARLNSSGGVMYSTFIGGGMWESGQAIEVDADGAMYIAGHTRSPDFPLVNPFDSDFAGEKECFVLKLDSTGSSILYSTFVGGSGTESVESMVIDEEGNTYLTGQTDSTDFPMVAAFDSTYNGGAYDCFVLKLNATGDGALFSTYVGGSGDECGNSIALGPDGNVFVAGETGSVDFPLVNPIGDSYGGGDSDGFVFKMRDLSDSDGDGLPDWWEIQYGLDHTSGDSQLDPDSDELSNLEEYQYGTNPVSNDTDSDGMSDGWEVFNLLDPLENDATQDVDLDGLTNLEEYRFGTNPHSNDTDSDNMPDEWEVRNGLNASAYDAFADPDSDGLSNMEEYQIGTHPNNNDTDSDGIPDGWEVTFGLDPLDSDSEEDNDLDGLTNLREFESGTDPFDNDSDSDGFLDGWEVHWGFDPMDPAVPLVELLAYNILGITAIVSIVTTVALTLVLGVKLQEKAKKRAKQEREEEVQRALVDLTESKRESA